MVGSVDSEVSGESNFEYVTSRVRVRKSKLFDEDDYRKLVRMQPNEIARFMEESEYSREVDRLASRYTGVDLIEYALYDNMARHFSDIVRWSNGKLHSLVVEYLRSYDAWNIKTVLRGVYTGATETEIKNDLILAGELDEEFFDQIVGLEDVEQVVEAVSDTVFGDSLKDAVSEFRETGVLLPLENAVDRTFYEQLVGSDGDLGEALQSKYQSGQGPRQVYNDLLRVEIDILNIRNTVRVAEEMENVDISDYFIEGGKVFSEDDLKRLSGNREELLNALRESEYGDRLEDAITSLEEAGSLTEFDEAIDRVLMGYSQRMTYQYPLSMAPVISYILHKEREVANIRAIARGKEAGLSREEIEDTIMVVE
ncbi:MAG: ATP synthase A1 subunit C [Halobacteria archaeon]|nr:ATP synthase A1 subunit C [Halobacteria archaeon]